MWIKVRTMDGKKSFQVDGLSKLTKIEELRERLEKDLEVPPPRQRLFFAGRQLEDGSTLFDYNVELNSLIQVMIRPIMSPVLGERSKNKESPRDKCDNNVQSAVLDEKPEKSAINDEKAAHEVSIADDEKPSSAYRWKVNDFVDAKDITMGAWFEATVQKVDLDENSEIRYHVTFDGYEENEVAQLTEKDVRPRARKKIPFARLEKGMIVMANYNCDEQRERGFWYDVRITRKTEKRSANKFYGKLLLGKDDSVAEECCILFVDEIFEIENSDTPTEDQEGNEQPEKRKVKPDCDSCRDDPNKNCKNCACHKCGSKDEPERTLMCDECDQPFHMRCLDPPMETLPTDDEWYCPLCKNDGSNVIKAGDKQKDSKKKAKMASANPRSTRDWGKGMACVGRTKTCTIVPPNHFGPVPGVPVGSCWKFRVQASETGVHRPHVSGIAGRGNEGAYSIVLAGGYEDDTDDGDEFTYTGSGGRDLSGNKRTAEQSFDQTLTKNNLAIAKNCDCAVSDVNGGEGKVWNKGKPIRVIRSYKFAKHSEYAPEEGVRYDGIYKVVKYWPEKGQSGFKVWRYRLRRDDASPAPWTKAGKKKIAELGLEIKYPEGYLEAQAKKEAEKVASKSENKLKRKRKSGKDEDSEGKESCEELETSMKKSPKKAKIVYSVSEEHLALINADTTNESIWKTLICDKPESHAKFLHNIEEKFVCICCQEVVFQPVTVECGHSTCKSCLTRAFKAGVYSCPSCRFGLDKDYEMEVNTALRSILVQLFPGYDAGR